MIAHSRRVVLAALALSMAGSSALGYLRLHPDNPHYFQETLTGKPVLIVGHWGCSPQSNAYETDYHEDLYKMGAWRCNYGRVWHFTPWEYADGLNPYWPWARSSTPGAYMGGNKFNLNTWDTTYWTRMGDAMSHCVELETYMEIMLFDRCGMSPADWYRWGCNPWAHDNNVNNLEVPDAQYDGTPEFYDYSSKPNLRYQQERYVRKMIDVTVTYDSVLYEIENEHWEYDDPQWVSHYSQFVKDYIAASYPGSPRLVSYSSLESDLDDCYTVPTVDMVNKHFGDELDNDPSLTNAYLEAEWGHNKAINIDEFGNGLTNMNVLREECWTIITSGGHFQIEDAIPDDSFAPYLVTNNIGAFIRLSGWDFVHAAPQKSLIVSGGGYCMRQSGVEYVCYFPSGGNKTVNLAAGNYRAEWWNPRTGGFYNVTSISHGGGNRAFSTPDGNDWVLHLTVNAAPTTVLQSKYTGSITIDGSSSDWNLGELTARIRGGDTGTGNQGIVGYDTNRICYKGGYGTTGQFPPGGVWGLHPEDHRVQIYSRNGASYLYFLVRCDDDDIRYPNGVDMNWANDCVEIYIDPGHDHGLSPMSSSTSDIQLVIDANNQKNVYMTTSAYKTQVLAGVTSAVVRDATGWWLEARIGKTALDPDIPVSGGTIGVDFSFRDNDQNSDTYSTAYTWRDAEVSSGFPTKIPHRWGDLELIAPSTPQKCVGAHYGVVDRWQGGGGTGDLDVIMQNLGARWIRTGFDWDEIETADDVYDWFLQDSMVTAMDAIGVSCFCGFSYTPAWARPGGTTPATPPTNPAKYTDFITVMVNRYSSSVKYWGFWNEPNLSGFYSGTMSSYIHNLLLPGIDAVKAADPTAKTVVGELATVGDDVGTLRTILQEITAHGKKDLVDVVCTHAYACGDTAAGRVAHMDAVHNMMVSEGWGDKDFWCTETSWDSGPFGETRQASELIGMVQGMDARPWWKKTFWYTLTEGASGGPGLIRPDHSLKPSYTQYQSYITEHADDAEVVSDTIPASMNAGQQYSVTVTMRNTGTVTWSNQAGYKLGAVGDSDPFCGFGRVLLDPGDAIAPDQQKTFSFVMTAPATPGTYTTDWQMVHELVRWFGHSLVKQVSVSGGGDTTPPGPVTNFTATAGDQQVSLSWTNPTDADFAGTMIRYKTTSYPTAPNDGAQVYNGTGTSCNHTGLTNGTTYYYSAFAYDEVPNYSTKTDASAIPADTTAPGPVTGFTATAGDQQVSLSWANPTDADFAGTMIRYKTTGYPTGPTNGTQVFNGPGTSCNHTGLTNGTTYYYSAFAHDEVPNYATKADASATPSSTPQCFSDSFAYANGNLNGNDGWSGSATSQIQVVDQTVKINGGATWYDARRNASCPPDAEGMLWVQIKIKSGTGTATMWNLYVDDLAGHNLARWYGSGTSARGRMGSTGYVTESRTLTGGWDVLDLWIDTLDDTSEFFFNGESLGTLDHSVTGGGDIVGQLRFERFDNSDAAGHYVYFDDLIVGEPGHAAADFDGDGDVDQEDFGHLQACFSGSGSLLEAGCEDADLDADLNVDQDDLALFAQCMNGADQPPPSGC